MKPNEIAIGEWVTCPTPFRVTGIYDDDPWVVYDEDGLPCELASVEPIPLTPEILEANGFRKSIEEGTYYFPIENEGINDRGFAIETFGDGVWFITDHILMQFMYIHQLQQALRLCGLNEIADNFRVV